MILFGEAAAEVGRRTSFPPEYPAVEIVVSQRIKTLVAAPGFLMYQTEEDGSIFPTFSLV